MLDILQWSAQYTVQTRDKGEVWPRTTKEVKELGFYASPWPIAPQEGLRHEVARNIGQVRLGGSVRNYFSVRTIFNSTGQ